MVISGPSSLPVRQQAREALQSLGDARVDWAARCEADRVLQRIEREGDTAEALLARVTRQAAGQRLKNESGVVAQKIALHAVAGGLTGAPSQVLARVACDVLDQVADAGNARQMGYTFLRAIADSDPGPREKALAEAVYDVSGQMLTHESGQHAQRQGLQLLADGLVIDGAPLPACGIARFGAAAVKAAATPNDACTIAAATLFKLEGTGLRATDDALVKAVTRAAEVCENREDAAAVLKDGLDMVNAAEIEGVEAKLAHFGNVARSHGGFVDARRMGVAVLEQIRQSTTDEAIRKMADKAITRSDPGAQSLWDRLRRIEPEGTIATLQRQAFTDIAAASPQVEKKAREEQLEELKRMAGVTDKPAAEKKTIEVSDDTIVIGGVRIRRHGPPAESTTSPASSETPS